MIISGKPGVGDLEQDDVDGPYDGEYLEEPGDPNDGGFSPAEQSLAGGSGRGAALAVSNPASPALTGLPWDAGAFQQAGFDADLQQYLGENPPLDFHNDPQALQAIMPQSPALPTPQDATHSDSQSKLGKLWRIAGPALRGAAMGGLAGSAGGSFGQGVQYAQQASQNLQQLQMQRQAAKDLSDWHQAQTARVRQQTSGIPQQQAAINSYRNARAMYLQAQTNKLKQAPSDKLVHTYNAADGKVHLVFEKPSGEPYERVSDASFFVHPAAQPKPLLAHGHDHAIYLIDPVSGDARKVVNGRTDVPTRKGTPGQFASVEKWKNGEWNRVNNNVLLSDDEKTQRLQNIQDQFERVITTLGGEPAHYTVPQAQGSAQQSSAPQLGSGQPSSQNDPWKLR